MSIREGVVCAMTIRVELIDGCCIQVVPRGLDLLLERRLVRRFMRGTGWAVVGSDPVRAASLDLDYSGIERRRQLH